MVNHRGVLNGAAKLRYGGKDCGILERIIRSRKYVGKTMSTLGGTGPLNEVT